MNKKEKESIAFYRTIQKYLTVYMPEHRRLSGHSIQASKDALNLMLDFMGMEKGIPMDKICFGDFSKKVIVEYLDWLGGTRKCKDSTINHRLSCVRSFFKYAAYEDVILMADWEEMKLIPLREIKEEHLIEFMSETALKAVLSCPDTGQAKGLRDCFYMTLLYDSAARDSELLHLKVGDFRTGDKAPCIVVTGKGNKRRIIPILQKTVRIYREYMKSFHTDSDPSEYLFYTRHHGERTRMSDDNVARFLKGYGKMARGLCDEVPEKITPHTFRRTRAMHLYRNGMPLPLLSEFLGHENPETTVKMYARADTEMKRKAIEAATAKSSLADSGDMPIWQGDNDMIRKLYGLK